MDQYVDVPGATARVRVARRDELPRMSDDYYPDIVADQRHQLGIDTADDAYNDQLAAIENAWLDHCDRVGKDLVFDARGVHVYINRGRWLADCPDCGLGMFCWDRNPRALCFECCRVFKARFDSPVVRAAAVRLLACREVANQNWDAHQGETIERLEFENQWYLDNPAQLMDGLWVPSSLRPGA